MELSIWRSDWMGVLKILLGSYMAWGINQFFGYEIGPVILASFAVAAWIGILFLGLIGKLK